MTVINLPSLFNEYYLDRCHRENAPGIGFDQIKLVVERVNWTRNGNIEAEGPTHTINITRREASPQAEFKSQIQIVKDCEYVCRVRPTDTIIGLNTIIHLPLTLEGIPVQFDKYVEMNPSQEIDVRRSIKTTVLSLEKEIELLGKTALVHCPQNVSEGRFSCSVFMTGKVIRRVNPHTVEQYDISEVIDYLQNKHKGMKVKKRKDLEALKVSGSKVFFTLKGEGEFQWPLEPRVEWR